MDNEAGDLMLRSEHSRSLEDAGKFQAIETLKELGCLIPLDQLDLFHGRVARTGDGEWAVNPYVDNSRNNTGNGNVNSRSTLYAGSQEDATAFADARRVQVIYPEIVRNAQNSLDNYGEKEKTEWLARVNREKIAFYNDQIKRGYKAEPPRTLTEQDLDDALLRRNERDLIARQISGSERINPESSIYSSSSEIHRITGSDPDATVVNFYFKQADLNPNQQERYKKALLDLAIPITAGSPVDFGDRDAIEPFINETTKGKPRYIGRDEIDEIVKKTGISERLALQLASASNSRNLAVFDIALLADMYLKSEQDIVDKKLDIEGEEAEYPINMDYAQRFFHEAHIVGFKDVKISATLDRDVATVSLFDLERIGTEKQIETKRQMVTKLLGPITDMLPGLPAVSENLETKNFVEILSDLHSKPETVVDAANKIPGFENIFEGPTGTWEGFSLGEHTETVLRNFEENFAGIMPVEYLPLLRLALVTHDLGKPEAVANSEKSQQKKYNAQKASQFLDTIGVNPEVKKLVMAVIQNGAIHAHNALLFPSDAHSDALDGFSKDTLMDLYPANEPSDYEIRNLSEVFKIFQTCDGGAYTSMAITRRPNRGRFRNAPSFNNSFASPISPGKRDIRYKSPDGPTAPPDLTPKSD